MEKGSKEKTVAGGKPIKEKVVPRWGTNRNVGGNGEKIQKDPSLKKKKKKVQREQLKIQPTVEQKGWREGC